MKCKVCGKQIKTGKSIMRGVGPVCYEREKGQLVLFQGEELECETKDGSERKERNDLCEKRMDLRSVWEAIARRVSAIGASYSKYKNEQKEIPFK